MIGARDLSCKILTGLLSAVATVNRPATGSLFQEAVLRLMGVQVAGPVGFGPGMSIVEPHHLRLGRYVSIGANARITCWAPVSIADDFLAAEDLNINSGGHQLGNLKPDNRPIRIGSRVWCGTRVTICAGVTIGDDSIIGAGAVVVRSVEPNTVVAGVPARPVRRFERAPGELWSNWPERSSFHGYPIFHPLAKLLLRLRSRL